MIQLKLSNGAPLYVNPEHVVSVRDAVGPESAGLAFVGLHGSAGGGTEWIVQGTAAAVAQQLDPEIFDPELVRIDPRQQVGLGGGVTLRGNARS